MDEWRRLGGRLRRRGTDWRLELHIPKSFSKERPPFTWTQSKFETSVAKHPLGAHLPPPCPDLSSNGTEGPLVFEAPDAHKSLLWPPNLPRSLDAYLYTDRPLISVHVVSFNDATFVSLSHPHTVCDVSGIKNILDAWALVVAGREADVLPLESSNPLESLGKAPAEPVNLELAGLLRGPWTTFFWRWFTKLDSRLGKRRGQTSFTICVSKQSVERLRREAIEYASTYEGKSEADPLIRKETFLSGGDIITSWCASLTALRSPSSTFCRDVVVSSAFSLRKRLPKLFDLDNKAYVQNAISRTWKSISIHEVFPHKVVRVSMEGIANVAANVRRSITEQTTAGQIEASAAVARKAMEARSGETGGFGGVMSMLVLTTNWEAGKFYEVDFSGAVLAQGQNSLAPSGRPSWISGWNTNTPPMNTGTMTVFVILGVDFAGNYWVSGRVDGLDQHKLDQALDVFRSYG